ncbi:MAG: hypothetical protein ACOYL5_07105 [Phototrophicaceae bacterium]
MNSQPLRVGVRAQYASAAMLVLASTLGAALILFWGAPNPTTALPSERFIAQMTAVDNYYNSDALALPKLYEVLWAGEIGTWQFAHANFLFPDFVLYILVRLLIPDLPASLFAYGIVQYGLLVWGNALLIGQVFKRPLWVVVSLLVSALAPVVLLTLGVGGFYLFIRVHHSSLLVMLPWMLLLLLVLLRRWQTHGRGFYGLLTLLLMLTLLTSLSDLFFVPHVMLPLLLALGVLWLCGQVDLRFVVLISAVMGAGVLLSRPLYNSITRVLSLGSFAEVTVAEVLSAVEYLWAASAKTFADTPILFLLALSFLGAGVLVVLVFIKTLTAHPRTLAPAQREGLFVVMGVWAAAVGALAFIVVFGLNNLGDITLQPPMMLMWFRSVDRYLLPTTFLATFLGWPYLLALVATVPRLAVPRLWQIVATVIFVVTLRYVGGMWQDIAAYGYFQPYYPNYIACLDQKTAERGLRYGVGGYWQSRQGSMLSRNGLSIAQVLPNLDPYLLLNNTLDFDAPFEFIITQANEGQSPTVQNVLSWFGTPDDVFLCDPFTILIYPPDAPAWNIIHEPLFLVDFSQVGASYTWGGSRLNFSQGESVNHTRTVAAGTGSAGNLTFGPYVPLPAGEYRFALEYSVEPADLVSVGSWDVAYWVDGQFSTLSQGRLSLDPTQLTETFVLPEVGLVEVRTFYENVGTLTIESLTISRVG